MENGPRQGIRESFLERKEEVVSVGCVEQGFSDITVIRLEASHSGLVHRLGKAAGSKGSREFESPRLRILNEEKNRRDLKIRYC